MAYLKIKKIGSPIGRPQIQKDTLRGLGLRRMNEVRVHPDTPAVRGMIQKVIHLVTFEKASSPELPRGEKLVTYRLGKVGDVPKLGDAASKTPKKVKKVAEKTKTALATKKTKVSVTKTTKTKK